MYEKFNDSLAQIVPVKAGVFGADMQVELINDGPVTIILDTKEARKMPKRLQKSRVKKQTPVRSVSKTKTFQSLKNLSSLTKWGNLAK